MAPRAHRRRCRSDEGQVRVRLWGFPSPPSNGLDCVPLSGGRVAAQGHRARRPRAAAASRPHERLSGRPGRPGSARASTAPRTPAASGTRRTARRSGPRSNRERERSGRPWVSNHSLGLALLAAEQQVAASVVQLAVEARDELERALGQNLLVARVLRAVDLDVAHFPDYSRSSTASTLRPSRPTGRAWFASTTAATPASGRSPRSCETRRCLPRARTRDGAASPAGGGSPTPSPMLARPWPIRVRRVSAATAASGCRAPGSCRRMKASRSASGGSQPARAGKGGEVPMRNLPAAPIVAPRDAAAVGPGCLDPGVHEPQRTADARANQILIGGVGAARQDVAEQADAVVRVRELPPRLPPRAASRNPGLEPGGVPARVGVAPVGPERAPEQPPGDARQAGAVRGEILECDLASTSRHADAGGQVSVHGVV